METTTLGILPAATTSSPWIPSMTENFLIVIFILSGILFAAVLFVVIRRVRIAKERAKRSQKEQERRAQITGPRPAEILEKSVYASVGTRSRQKNGFGMPLSRTGNANPLMFRSLTLDTTTKSTQMTPPPVFHTLNRSSRQTHQPPDGAARMVTFDPGRTEVISSVPMCKVTPLTPRSGAPSQQGSSQVTGSSSLEDYSKGGQYTAYHYSSSASDTELKAERLSLDRATGYKKKKHTSREHHHPQSKAATKLKDNQYWV